MVSFMYLPIICWIMGNSSMSVSIVSVMDCNIFTNCSIPFARVIGWFLVTTISASLSTFCKLPAVAPTIHTILLKHCISFNGFADRDISATRAIYTLKYANKNFVNYYVLFKNFHACLIFNLLPDCNRIIPMTGSSSFLSTFSESCNTNICVNDI